MAALNFDIFHKYTRRLKMANIAQIVNVLQSMILTKGDKIVLTPTYHVFRMYNVHQDATYVPCEYDADNAASPSGRPYPGLSASASSKDGALHVSVANTSLDKARPVELAFDSLRPGSVKAEILRSGKVSDYNDFDDPDKVKPEAFTAIKTKGGKVCFTLPAASIVVLEIK